MIFFSIISFLFKIFLTLEEGSIIILGGGAPVNERDLSLEGSE